MSDEKITYEIVIDDSKATATGKKVADTFKNVADSQKQASASSKDYSQALDKLAPGLSSTVSGLGGVLQSFKAILLNPIGLVLAAVAGAFTVIKAAIEKSEPALDFIENIFSTITTTIDTLLSNLDLVGKFFGNILVGNLDAAGDAFNSLTKEISENNKEAQKYLDLSRELEDAQFAFRLSTADTENKIKALIIASKNRNLSFDEAQAKIKQAIELERGLTEQRKKLADQEAEIGVADIARKKGIRKQDDEDFDAFVKRITESGKFSKEENDAIVGFYEKSKQAASDSLSFQEKVQNQLDAINQKKADDARKRADELQKIKDETENRDVEINRQQLEKQKEFDAQATESLEKKYLSEQEIHDLIISNGEAELESEQKIADAEFEIEKKKTAAKKQQTQTEFLLGQQKLANASTVLNQVSGLIDKESAAYKLLAISQASIDTYRAAAAALAPPPVGAGPLFGPILAATTIALGLANVAKIAGFAEGGLSGTKILSGMGKSIYRSNGDNMLATVRTGEVILNERQQAALGGASTFARIGVPGFADGGIATPFETSAVATQINNERQLSTLISVIKNSSQRVLVIEDVESLIDQRLQIRENAQL